MRTFLIASLTAAAFGLAPADAAQEPDTTSPPAATSPAPEPAIIDGIKSPIPVLAKKDLTFRTPKVQDLARTELWYRSYDDKTWGPWQKHGIVFDAGTPIVWTPPEGIWQIYQRPVLTSNLAEADPTQKNVVLKPALTTTFVIDRTPPTTNIVFPPPKAKLRGGDTYKIKWDASDPYLRAAPVTLSWSRDGSKWEVIADHIANNGEYAWTVPVDMTVNGQLKIEVTDKADNVGTAVNSSILVDSIKPTGKFVGPPITNTVTTTLTLDIRDGGPAGLQSAQLWMSQDDGTSWTEGPWIKDPKSVAWTAPGDGRYRLYILAVDQAGNQSAPPKGKVGDVIAVDTTPPLVRLNAAIGIIPADAAQANNRRAFKPGDRVQVQFIVKDQNPATNSVAIYLQTGPDKWQELAKGQPLDQPFRFEIPAIATKEARIKVTAADLAGNVGEATSAEAFEIQTAIIIEDNSGPLVP